MSLLSEQKRALAHDRAREFKLRRVEAARAAYYGLRDGKASQLPIGLTRLEDPSDRDVWKRFISREAAQEQRGMLPSDIATTVISHPDVRQAFLEESQP